jgi:hypothetical protein
MPLLIGQQINTRRGKTHLASISSLSSGDLWIDALSMTTTELGKGNEFIQLRRPSMKALKSFPFTEAGRTVRYNTLLRDSAGRTEYPERISTIR